MSPLLGHCAQNLVMCGIDLVLLLLLLIFCDTLLSYSLTLIRTLTAPSIPVRRNKGDPIILVDLSLLDSHKITVPLKLTTVEESIKKNNTETLRLLKGKIKS